MSPDTCHLRALINNTHFRSEKSISKARELMASKLQEESSPLTDYEKKWIDSGGIYDCSAYKNEGKCHGTCAVGQLKEMIKKKTVTVSGTCVSRGG